MLGMYVLVADDTDKTYTSEYKWNPALFPYQAKGANTLFLTFLNPAKMPAVPPAMANLAQSRGTGQPGAVPSNTTIMFAIGGQAYSEKPNPWDWLTTTDKAEAMAAEVAQWLLRLYPEAASIPTPNPVAMVVTLPLVPMCRWW